MSKCMTIDETIDQKDTFSEVTPKDIVDSVLEEILVSVLTVSDKGCNRIGDFNISEDFCQQFNQPLHIKDFEQASIKQASSAGSLYSGKNKERSGNGNENLEADWLGKIEEKVKPAGECKVISEEILANNELQIQNGQIHLERIKSSLESAREEYYQKENVIKDDKIEIEYYNQGKLNKIYVPLNQESKESNLQLQSRPECEDENKKELEKENSEKKSESPFKPFIAEDLRQVWANENSSLIGKWDGDMAGQPEEIVKLMEGLSNIRVYPEGSADPNRPRTCSVAEEDIKKMIKEIEEISFIQSHDNVEDYPPEGQGDADLESKSFTKSRDVLNKPRTESRLLPEDSSDGIKKPQEEEVHSTEIRQDPDSESIPYIVKEPSTISLIQNLRYSQTSEIHDCSQEGRFGENNLSEEHMLESNLQGETSAKERLLTSVLDVKAKNSACVEEMRENTEFSASGSVDLLGSQDRIFAEKEKTVNSSSISGNDIFSEFKVSSDLGVRQPLPTPVLSETAEEEQKSCSWSTKGSESPSNGNIKRFSVEECAIGESIVKESTVEENAEKESVAEKNVGKEDIVEDNVEKESLVEVNVEKESVAEENVGKEDIVEDNVEKESVAEENVGKEDIVEDNVEKESVAEDNVEKESIVEVNVEKEDIAEENVEKESIVEVKVEEEDIVEVKVEEEDIVEVKVEEEDIVEVNVEKEDVAEENVEKESIVEVNVEKESIVEVIMEKEDIVEANVEKESLVEEHAIEENAVEENAVEENGKHPSQYRLTEALSQRSNSSSRSHKSSAQNVTQSKELGSLQSQESLSSENQSEDVDSEKSESRKFKLHSIKMCLKMGCDPAGLQKSKSMRSESEEAFVESMESVLQIIEPEENCQNEESESTSVTFSLLAQETNGHSQKSVLREVKSQPVENVNNEDLPGDEISEKTEYSGMTTIGPMKNTNYDPKDLRAPEIDFGKMTRITSSRQLAKDFNLLGADFTSTTTVKILEDDDSDASITESDSDILETGSPVNRDIASLTKVQKIREVMSYQPKPEEDFEDEEALPKTRLDLKDVESSTDERFKVPEVGIPLLSFDVTTEAIGTETEAEKQLIESMGLIISGLTEPYYENLEENNEGSESKVELIETAKESVQSAEAKKEIESINGLEKESSEKDITDISSETVEESIEESKYKTLSGVIKKASKKFMRKDSDLLLRNSKSLPRDTSKITADRIRSILNESSTSASNVLKKSRSMLRSTQSLIKSISQNRMIDETEKHKTSPSETDLNNVERKLPFLLESRKEDFVKAKNLIKATMEKTFKRQENPPETAAEQPEVSREKKDLQVVVRNEEKLRVDRMENFKRWLPKSTLVYKSQFVKSEIKIKDKTPETDANSKKDDDNVTDPKREFANAADEETVTVQEIANECEVTLQQEQNENTSEKFIIEQDLESARPETQPGYIVMETVQGLPTLDLESFPNEKENVKTNITSLENLKENEHQVNVIQPQAGKEKELDIIAEATETEERQASKISPERKVMTKKKKLSTRLRNFWCSAFGRVKSPPKKSDVS